MGFMQLHSNSLACEWPLHDGTAGFLLQVVLHRASLSDQPGQLRAVSLFSVTCHHLYTAASPVTFNTG
ncbi:hypothetical protein BV326_03514 [Pseudomonas syringae pv. actinidiae]|nr:hypothetical protein BV326_03514 [Pseudomonas syringae pv. actinidiae]